MTASERKLLAILAAKGILDVNSANAMPVRHTVKSLQEMMPAFGVSTVEAALISRWLENLEALGYVKSWDTSYYGYGDHYVKGVITWYVTAAGLVALWTGA